MAVDFGEFNDGVMRKLFPHAWPQRGNPVPVKEKGLDGRDTAEGSESVSYPSCETDSPEPEPEVKTGKTPEASTPELFSLSEEPEDKSENPSEILSELDHGQTVYRNPHKGTWKGNRFEMQIPDPLPPDEHPRNLDELLIFLDECGIKVTATTDGFIFTGGTEDQRRLATACLDSCVWTYGNLRLYLKGELKEIDGRRYIHPKLRGQPRNSKVSEQIG